MEKLIVEYFANGGIVTICSPQRYRRATHMLSKWAIKSRPSRVYRGMC